MERRPRTRAGPGWLALPLAIALLMAGSMVGSGGLAPQAEAPPGEDLYAVTDTGEILARPGVTWSQLATAGIHPSEMYGAEPIEIPLADLIDAGIDPGRLLDEIGGSLQGNSVRTWLFPLAAAPPSWLTEDLEERFAAGERVAATEIPGFPGAQTPAGETPAPVPWTSIMPGMGLFKSGSIILPFCTANFIFEANGELYIGTAGHCLLVNGVTIYTKLLDPASGLVASMPLGEAVYSTGNGGVGTDFALIRIREEVHHLVDPRISVVDGPCGHRSASSGNPVLAHGHGLVIGAGGTARAGSVLSTSPSSMNYLMPVSFGDSGSPVRLDAGVTGPAAAITTHGLPYVMGLGTTLARALSLATDAGFPVSLVDSPACG